MSRNTIHTNQGKEASSNAWRDHSLALVGLMGTGKSTVGRRLARQLGMPFFDADEEIEKASAMSVAEIFEHYGEEYFRDGERRVISRLVADRRCVLATGGGAFMNADTRKLILDQTIAIWLDASIDTLVKRVSRRNTRPLLRNKDPETVLSKLAAERNPVYAQAPIHVESNATPHQKTVQDIIRALGEWKP